MVRAGAALGEKPDAAGADIGARLLALVGNSFILAGLAAAAGVALATAMAYAARLSPGRLVAAANRAASLGYAIPGAVIAVGVLVPLGERSDILDVPARLGLPVLLVVGMRLGCLNHALLSAEAIAARGLALAGWVGNGVDPRFARREANLETLRARLAAPCLGIVPWMEQPDVDAAARSLVGVSRILRIPLN